MAAARMALLCWNRVQVLIICNCNHPYHLKSHRRNLMQLSCQMVSEQSATCSWDQVSSTFDPPEPRLFQEGQRPRAKEGRSEEQPQWLPQVPCGSFLQSFSDAPMNLVRGWSGNMAVANLIRIDHSSFCVVLSGCPVLMYKFDFDIGKL